MADTERLIGRAMRSEEIIALGRGRVPDDLIADAMKQASKGCCGTQRKPCSYHEGFLDGMDILTQLMEAR